MSSIKQIQAVSLWSLERAEQIRLLEQIYALQAQIFDGKDKDSYVNNLLQSTARQITVYQMKDQTGALVGYNLVFIYEWDENGKRIAIFRSDAGIQKEYRGNNLMAQMAIRDAFRYKLRYPWREGYFVALLVHPSVYYSLAKYAYQIYPNPENTTPSRKLEALLGQLAKAFSMQPVRDTHPWLHHASRATKESPEERVFWQQHSHPSVQFFLNMNPDYQRNQGLLTILPITFSNITFSFFSFLSRSLRRRFTKTRR